jgi:hypothetical protein
MVELDEVSSQVENLYLSIYVQYLSISMIEPDEVPSQVENLEFDQGL